MKHYTHFARLHTRNVFSCVWLKGPTRLRCLDCSISVRVISKQSSHSSHAMFSTLLDPPFTAPTQSTSTSSSLLFSSSWTPSAAPLFNRFAEQSSFTGYESNAPIEVTSMAGDRSDVGRLASPLFYMSERQVLIHLVCPFLTRVEASSNRQREITIKESPVETQVLHIIFSWIGKRFCLKKKIFITSSEGKLIKPSEKTVQLKQNYLKHRLNWTDENGRCRVLTELFMILASSFNSKGWNFIKRIN